MAAIPLRKRIRETAMRVEIDESPQVRIASYWHAPGTQSCGRNDSGASETIEGDIAITEDGQDEGVMDADAVGERAFSQGNDGATYDRCN
jgi:hypothetical protein